MYETMRNKSFGNGLEICFLILALKVEDFFNTSNIQFLMIDFFWVVVESFKYFFEYFMYDVRFQIFFRGYLIVDSCKGNRRF